MSFHAAFDYVSDTRVESLNLTIQHFVHRQTGAVHYHLASEHEEKVFMVALRTMPKDSTGVAHILEHTALCGSQKYPVRDPFFMMTRRSLNTFMNAMTSSDWTAYPFASQNDKDFNNLLDVYLDAVFFARLDELDFAQEGHRIEFSEPGNRASALAYKGVVFNEMKGAMSSPVAQLWQGISSYLFPTTTYHYNSGGDPAEITDLTYSQLLNFYQSHYHPSNAIIMTFGKLDVEALQRKMDKQALSCFQRQPKQWRVAPEKRYSAPLAVQAHYGVDGEDLSGKTHHVLGWLLGDSTDLDAQLEASLLSQVLLDNSSSPLRRALEETPLAGSPSPLCGLEDSNREMSFMCGVEGSEPEHAAAIESLVLSTLKQVVLDGIEPHVIEAALHQLELHQREIGGDGTPYGLQLILNALPAATHYGDPVKLLNLEPALQRLRDKAAHPNFIADAIQRLLLNNRHRVRYSLVPDAGLNAENKRLESAQLAHIKAAMSDEQLALIEQQAERLLQRQLQEDDASMLPQVTLADVPPTLAHVDITARHDGPLPICEYVAGTNGILYQQLIADLPSLTFEQLTWLPFMAHAWTEVGAGEHDYLQQQQRQTATVGSLSAYTQIKGAVDDCQRLQGYVVMSGKALATQVDAFSGMQYETWTSPNFTEQQRLLDLLVQVNARKQQGMTGSGHLLAMSMAAAPLNLAANVANELAGLPQAARIKQRLARARDDGGAALASTLTNLYQVCVQQPSEALAVHDQAASHAHLTSITQRWSSSSQLAGSVNWTLQSQPTYWMVDSQVNFCAWALPTVSMTHPDAAALSVLAGVLRNGFLHGAIREQGGAYGGGASQDSALACFKFYSYRDPRVEGTFADFKASIDWVLDKPRGDDLVESAILGIIGSMDRPASPAGEAKNAYHLMRSGRSLLLRQTYRQQLLAVRWHDVQRVALQYLRNQDGVRAVVAPRGTEAVADNLGLNANDY